MSKELEHAVSRLASIRVDLQQRTITFEAEDHAETTLTLLPDGVLYKAIEGERAIPQAPPELESAARPIEPLADGEAEHQPPVTLTGRLKSKPVEGRRDGKGKPTAWARLAVHEDGEPTAHVYGATFHRHTAKIALSLAREASVTVQGYPHQSGDPSGKRLDTFSVVNIVDFPGKPPAQGRREGDHALGSDGARK